MVKAASQEFKGKHRYEPPNGAALIADLSFGFWTTLFTKTYFELLNRAPLNAFNYRPRGTGRDIAYDKLQEIRLFRNRVYHYEPLCFQSDPRKTLIFSQLENIHATICELLAWLDPTLPEWLAEVDRVPETLKKLKRKYPDAS